MEKNITALCIDYGNDHMEDVVHLLQERGAHVSICRVSTWPDTGAFSALLKEIEQKEGRLDLLIFGANDHFPEEDGSLLKTMEEPLISMQEIIEASLPLLRMGIPRRICMITRACSSVSLCRDSEGYGRHMTLAGLNMTAKILFNRLRPEGFTFRWYCAGEKDFETPGSGMSAGEYFLTNFCYDEKEPYLHSEENRFVMKDAYLREIPW